MTSTTARGAGQNKIVFTGPVGVGKTTAINALSDIPTVTTEARASDQTARIKTQTTVAFDYGVMKLGHGEQVHLYGTPGQERFDFMWEILAQGAIGLVLLLDNTRSDRFGNMHFFLRAFGPLIAGTGLVIGITHMDSHKDPGIDAYYRQLDGTGLRPPIFEVDARRREDVSLLVQALLYSLDPGLRDGA